MKSKVYLLIILLSPLTILSQTDTVFLRYINHSSEQDSLYVIDTISKNGSIYRDQILIGTGLLSRTYDQMAALEFGVQGAKVTETPCSRGEKEGIETEIIKLNLSDTALSVDCLLEANCCFAFACDYSIIGDSILFLKYTGFGSVCGCSCCFGLNYTFELDRENKDFRKLKYIRLQGSEKKKLIPHK